MPGLCSWPLFFTAAPSPSREVHIRASEGPLPRRTVSPGFANQPPIPHAPPRGRHLLWGGDAPHGLLRSAPVVGFLFSILASLVAGLIILALQRAFVPGAPVSLGQVIVTLVAFGLAAAWLWDQVVLLPASILGRLTSLVLAYFVLAEPASAALALLVLVVVLGALAIVVGRLAGPFLDDFLD